jgi:transposase-like protein
LDAEMEEFLGYNKSSHEGKETENRRNGYTSKSKKVKTDYGEITICPPRDRKGEFEPQIVKKRQKVLEGFDDIAIAMYAKGISLKDISEMIKQIYKVELSVETISNLTSAVSEEVKTWQNRKLEKFYPFIYVDCLYAPVKKDLISEKTAVYVMLGINKEGKKEVLGIWINQTESATFWTSVFEEIKERGVEEILFVSMDGLAGLPEAIEKVYPKSKTQRCIVHIVRNIYSTLDKKKAKEIIGDFKEIYKASNINNAKLAYENFIEKYKENSKLIKKVNSLIEYVFSIFEYPIEIRRIIYTTNPIESLNSCLRKVTRGKGSFISTEALLKVIYLRIKDLEKNWSISTRNWSEVQNQIVELFGDRVIKYYIEEGDKILNN